MTKNRVDEVKKILYGYTKNAYPTFDDLAKEICQLFPQPLDDKDRLLTKEERIVCIPTPDELEAYLATPDDAVAQKLRESLPPELFEKLGFIILYTENIEKAQDAKTSALLQPKIEEAKRERDMVWQKGIRESRITTSDMDEILQALKGGE